MNWAQLLQQIENGNIKTLARVISFIENDYAGYDELMQMLPVNSAAKTIGITGPPGAGKSSLVDALTGLLTEQEKKIAIVCVDPSSPFNHGALLGDRIRMSRWYNTPNVYIRSLATRGSLGGLHPKMIEINDLLNAAHFDYIIIETVGVGQNEIEIAGLADTTVVVLVPEAGDDIQAMKSGLMEIADVFAINKCDRPGADAFAKNLRLMLAPDLAGTNKNIAIVKTNAIEKKGIEEFWVAINEHLQPAGSADKKSRLLADKAYYLIQQKRMKDVDKQALKNSIEELLINNQFNLYQLVNSIG